MNPNILIADTGSTDNTTGSMFGAFHIRRYKGPPTKTATNEDMIIKAEFDFKGMITDRYRYGQQALFKNFKYIPNAPYTLVAIGKYLLIGWRVEGNKTMGLRLSKADWRVTFDLPVYTTEGVLFTMYVKRQNPETERSDFEVSCFNCRYTYQQAHRLLGHTNEEYTR